jgi:hypothetical protein
MITQSALLKADFKASLILWALSPTTVCLKSENPIVDNFSEINAAFVLTTDPNNSSVPTQIISHTIIAPHSI